MLSTFRQKFAMKTNFTLLIFISFAFLLNAQPVIHNDFVDPGDSFAIKYTNESIDPGPAGADVTWDFSNVQGNYIDFDWSAKDPSDSPFAELFENATVYFEIPPEVASEVISESYIYYDNSGDQVSYLGSVIITNAANSQDTQFLLLTQDADIMFEYPVTFGDQFNDAIEGTNTLSAGGQMFTLERTGNTTTEADGYGTLITPLGIYENVLRVKRTEVIEDRFPGVPQPTTQVWERYDWMSPDRKYILFHTEKVSVQGMPDSGTTYYTDADVISSIDNHADWNVDLNIFPNPATEEFHISFANNHTFTELSVTDVTGRRLLHKKVNSNLVSIDVSDWETGVYMIHLSDNGRQLTRLVQKY